MSKVRLKASVKDSVLFICDLLKTKTTEIKSESAKRTIYSQALNFTNGTLKNWQKTFGAEPMHCRCIPRDWMMQCAPLSKCTVPVPNGTVALAATTPPEREHQKLAMRVHGPSGNASKLCIKKSVCAHDLKLEARKIGTKSKCNGDGESDSGKELTFCCFTKVRRWVSVQHETYACSPTLQPVYTCAALVPATTVFPWRC